MLSQNQIQQIVDTIVKGYHPEKVIIFGSYVNGTANEGSDLDFLIIKKTKEGYYKRSGEIHKLFTPYPCSMDILVYTPKEYKSRKNVIGTFANIVHNTGKVIYEK
ncbi:MAG: nucleotidyltransferase domain-containing protein [Chitinophagales bacterium]